MLSGAVLSKYAGAYAWSIIGLAMQDVSLFLIYWGILGKPSYSNIKMLAKAFIYKFKEMFRGRTLLKHHSETNKFSTEIKKEIKKRKHYKETKEKT